MQVRWESQLWCLLVRMAAFFFFDFWNRFWQVTLAVLAFMLWTRVADNLHCLAHSSAPRVPRSQVWDPLLVLFIGHRHGRALLFTSGQRGPWGTSWLVCNTQWSPWLWILGPGTANPSYNTQFCFFKSMSHVCCNVGLKLPLWIRWPQGHSAVYPLHSHL